MLGETVTTTTTTSNSSTAVYWIRIRDTPILNLWQRILVHADSDDIGQKRVWEIEEVLEP